MMKNRNLIVLFSVIIVALLIFIPCVQATSNIPIISLNNETPPTTENTDNTENTTNTVNNENANVPNINTNTGTNTGTNNDNVATNNLPQTGVAEDTTLFVFITVCIVSAIYAFIKIRKYKNM